MVRAARRPLAASAAAGYRRSRSERDHEQLTLFNLASGGARQAHIRIDYDDPDVLDTEQFVFVDPLRRLTCTLDFPVRGRYQDDYSYGMRDPVAGAIDPAQDSWDLYPYFFRPLGFPVIRWLPTIFWDHGGPIRSPALSSTQPSLFFSGVSWLAPA